MKTILIFILFAVGCQLNAQTSTQITFGRYSDGNGGCTSGRGACSFSLTNDNKAAIVTRIDDVTVKLQLPISNISYEDQVSIAGKRFSEIKSGETTTFFQNDDLYLGLDFIQSLKIDEKHNAIISGSYPMIITAESVQIFFTLKATHN